MWTQRTVVASDRAISSPRRTFTEEILIRAEKLEASGFDSYDAIHLASAAQAKVDVFLTTDDGIQKIANRKKAVFSFAIANPVSWLE